MARFCVYDDKEVKPMTEAKRDWGKGEQEAGFIHVSNPNCGRRVVDESHTYTEGESDPDSREE